jgi:hypothetical protein
MEYILWLGSGVVFGVVYHSMYANGALVQDNGDGPSALSRTVGSVNITRTLPILVPGIVSFKFI